MRVFLILKPTVSNLSAKGVVFFTSALLLHLLQELLAQKGRDSQNNIEKKGKTILLTPRALILRAVTGNNKGSGELHEKALSNWFSTETMKDDFDWWICYVL